MALDHRFVLKTFILGCLVVFLLPFVALGAVLHIEHFKYSQAIVIPIVKETTLTGFSLSNDLIDHTNNLQDIRIVDSARVPVAIAFTNDIRVQSLEETYIRADVSVDASRNVTTLMIDRRMGVVEHRASELSLLEGSYTGTVTLETSADNNHWTLRNTQKVTGTGTRVHVSYEPTTDRFIRITLSGTNVIASKLVGITSRIKYLLFTAEPKQTYTLYYGSAFATAVSQKKFDITENDLETFFSVGLESKIGLRNANPAYKDINQEAKKAIGGLNEQFPYTEPILYILGSVGVLYIVFLVLTRVEGKKK